MLSANPSDILWALDRMQIGKQEARNFVYRSFSYDEFIPFEQHYDFLDVHGKACQGG